jgi:hypothetical protein
MAEQLSRRQILKLGLLSTMVAACTPAAPGPAAGGAPGVTSGSAVERRAEAVAALSAPTTSTALAQNVTKAAQSFLDALDDGPRTKATYAFDDSERVRWHWTTPSGFPRNGLPLREMTDAQKPLAHALLAASVSGAGYEKAVNIMGLQNDLGNDPELYYVTVFGVPGEGAWGWRWEGHHLSRQFTIAGDEVAMTPFFLGAWPTVSGGGLRAMASEEDLALALAASLGEPAIFQPNTLTRHVTQNEPRVEPLEPVGVAYRDMIPAQQQLVTELLQTYLGVMPEFMAAAQTERIDGAGREEIRFGWAGPLELRRPTYYRLQGPTFLLEHDKSRNGGTHIHSVWRDFERDFGYHLSS